MSASSAARYWKQGYKNIRVVLGGKGALQKAGFMKMPGH